MKSILEAFNKRDLNIQKPLVAFFGMNNATILTLMTEKFLYSTEENRRFKLKKTEYSQFVTYHSFTKAVEYFERMGILRTYDDANGIQMGLDYQLNPNKLETIFNISLRCSNKSDYFDYINEYTKEDFNLKEIERAIK